MKVTLAVCLALLAVVLAKAEDGMVPPVLPAASRIVNGRPAKTREFPYLAYIEAFTADGSLYERCAGSLITRSAVLTRATYCVYGDGKKWTVRLGSIYRTGNDPNAWSVESVMAIMHPNYNNKTWDNNIAIIQLPRLAPANDFIKPVSLACSRDDSSYIGRQAIVAGWGRPHPDSGISDVLRWTEALVVHNDFCEQLIGHYAVTDRQLCAGSNKTTPYRWDGGAPLVLYNKGRYTQIGVFSLISGWTFNTPNPAIYTRVSSFLDWIKLYTESD